MINTYILENLVKDPLDVLTLKEQKFFDDILVNLWLKDNSFARINDNVLVYKDSNFYDLLNNGTLKISKD